MIAHYQSRILLADEVVDYRSEMMHSFRPEHLLQEPMVGFKVLCKDLNAMTSSQADRFQLIERNIGFLRNSGCIIRETH